jgi:hypothetical protein
MTDLATAVYAANLDMRRFNRGIQGDLRFDTLTENTWHTFLQIKRGWCADYVVNQASGIPEVQIEVADLNGNLNAVLKDKGIQAVLVEGVRYEKRDQDLLIGSNYRVFRLRCQPIGEDDTAQAFSRVAQTRKWVQ